MKITDVTKIYGVYEIQPAAGAAAKKAPAAAGKDGLMLSRDALDFQAVMKGLKEAPDIRAGAVADLSAKYEAGTYRADAREVAEALFKSGAIHRAAVKYD